MIRHVVLFKFREGVTWSDPRAQVAEEATRRHPEFIPEILSWECGRNEVDRPVAYDFALIGGFADPAAVTRYLEHPDHQRGVALWRELAEWNVVDFPHPAAVIPARG
ncbi:Dabb family protein [Kitasatospora sp. NBC_00315]|uniref:Dabb family protein n=1 Tax=Kitasatospora sp. NBC_00315 TaxID=2975963 RepID=UPI003245B27F